MNQHSVAIAVHDTGVDLMHPLLRDCLLPGISFDRLSNAPWPSKRRDPWYHGTAAAIIASGWNSGVTMRPSIVPVRFNSSNLSGWVNSLEWAAKRAQVVLCAWTVSGGKAIERELTSVIEKWSSIGRGGLGTVFVCATGKAGEAIGFPASLPFVIPVRSTTPNRVAITSDCNTSFVYSSFGPQSAQYRIPLYDFSKPMRPRLPDENFGGSSALASRIAFAASRLIAECPGLGLREISQQLSIEQ